MDACYTTRSLYRGAHMNIFDEYEQLCALEAMFH